MSATSPETSPSTPEANSIPPPTTPTSKSPAIIMTCPPPPRKPRPASRRKRASPGTNHIYIDAEELELLFFKRSTVSASLEKHNCLTPILDKSKLEAVERRRCPAAPRKVRLPAACRKRRLEEVQVIDVGAEELRSLFQPRNLPVDSWESAKKRKKISINNS
ncbi:hypothetical protein IEQ34_007975 [Dendrobium chrysotoxum]|uniref:Uncharacterized protein n=1 Tax=Dendrobium chrysotoxum TaxID=161865 RepID=A0AAV7H5Y3_DENCH|nr:hypothetical protein IEQ34_007975 [Dendrobium chrysotoxum]